MNADRMAESTKIGFAFWMGRVLAECDLASADFAPDPVHDLRVALRRCRSIADGLMAMDPDPAWKQMKKAGKRLFQSLGELRDVHVMEEWVHQFDSPGDPVAGRLFEFLARREIQLKQDAASALQQFDRKQWRKWGESLPRRAQHLRPGSALFKHLALERWTEAYELHRRALRNRSQAAWHRLRIGIKRFRYIVENFLPEQHALWGNDLKKLQDMLGQVHDLDVLGATAQQVNAFPDDGGRSRWQTRIREERERRIEGYRQKMMGKTSLWQVWRSALPAGKEIEAAAFQRLRNWASVLDPDFRHSSHVVRLALQLYQGLLHVDGRAKPPEENARGILRLAAILHDVGRSKNGKGHHKATYRMIQRLKAPLGIDAAVLRKAGIVARYHRGALPRAGQKALQKLTASERQEILWLAGILRLANAFDCDHKGRITRLEVRAQESWLVIAAQGYSPRDRLTQSIAAGRHLLEIVCRCPLMVRPLRPKARRKQLTPKTRSSSVTFRRPRSSRSFKA
jgi:CHAD domain-containing protein